jgi:hypothetical protein
MPQWMPGSAGGRRQVPPLGARQSYLQATIVGTHINGGRRTPSDHPAGHGGYALLHLRSPGGGTGPAFVGPAGSALCGDGCRRLAQGLGAPVLIHLSLGDVFSEAMSIWPMDMDVGDNLILCWDWISSHYLQSMVIGHGELRRLLSQIVRDYALAVSMAIAVTLPASLPGPLAARSKG